ncbi:phosphoesterase PA-phosphatase [Kineococcus glutinatus]|uniref:PAP2 superfamily protein n=1 Tax=Kineococcus glutinatus TaxID=1070872 RepID=A0ABP9H920_9ACTN
MSGPTMIGRETEASTSLRVARVLSEVLAPWICAAVMPPVVAAMTTTPWWKGALHGLLVTALAAAVPYAVVARQVRTGRLSDRHISRREDRPRLLAMAVGCVLVALLVVRLLGASTSMQVFVLLMLASVGVGAVISRVWKVSMHALVLAASVTVLVGLRPALAPLAVLVPLVGWARWRETHHSPSQVVTGAALGLALAAGALAFTP